MPHCWASRLKDKDVTDENVFFNRRKFLSGVSGLGISTALANPVLAKDGLEPNSWEDITSYNNFYEFGTRKDDPKRFAGALTTRPWSLEITGLVDRPGFYDFEDILKRWLMYAGFKVDICCNGSKCGVFNVIGGFICFSALFFVVFWD